VPSREVRATYDDTSIVVYQAYGPAIADVALATGRFGAPFSRDRMTWIKPSFTWMAYRSGWATKPGQERVLAIRITRAGWEWALAHACLSHFDPDVHGTEGAWRDTLARSPVRVQWDPERDAALEPLPERSIQVGLSGEAVVRYVDEWVQSITDVTGLCHTLAALPPAERVALLPVASVYPLPSDIAATIGAG
jgi:hypothetical protein